MTTTLGITTWHSAPLLSWAAMRAAGLDTDRIEAVQGETDTYTLSVPETIRVTFGVCPDPECVCEPQEHTGWSATRYGWDPQAQAWEPDGVAYYALPRDLRAMLTWVRGSVAAAC